MNNVGWDEAGITALVVAISQFAKSFVPEKFIPLVPVVFGVAFSVAMGGITLDYVLKGVVIGLTAAGLYQQPGVKKLAGMIKK